MIRSAAILLSLGLSVVGMAGCAGSSSGGQTGAPGSSVAAVTATSSAGDSSSVTVSTSAPGSDAAGTAPENAATSGSGDLASICPQLPVADAQALIRTELSDAVVDDRLGGCTFVLAGNQLADSNLTVAIAQGDDAVNRYDDDVSGVFSVGDATVPVGAGMTDALTGVGDKAVWDSNVGYPEVSALKGEVYCAVSTTADATQLTIIGSPNNPLPQGTQDQQAQYAQLEGKLCTDMFALVG